MLPRFRHVLVPIDLSNRSQITLDMAFELAEVNAARVTLLHVIERLDAAAEDSETSDFYRRLERRADAQLERCTQRFVDCGIPVEYKVRLGKRVVEIVRYVTEHSVDLVILSSHAVDPDQPEKCLSTISYQVSVLSPCPILLMK